MRFTVDLCPPAVKGERGIELNFIRGVFSNQRIEIMRAVIGELGEGRLLKLLDEGGRYRFGRATHEVPPGHAIVSVRLPKDRETFTSRINSMMAEAGYKDPVPTFETGNL